MILLVEWLWQGLLVAAISAVAIRVIPQGAASMRHAIWWLALVMVLLLPWLPAEVVNAVPGVPGIEPLNGSAGSAMLTVPAPPAWPLMALAAVWVTSALLGVVRLLLNLRSLQRLTRGSRPLDAMREARLTRWNAERGSGTALRATLKVSNEIRGACVIGFRRPTILVSSALVATLDDTALEAIVLHEHAHLQRYDDWTRLLQRFVLTAAGLHPAVRWISGRIDLEREIACDQRVVAKTGAPVTYARSLAEAAAVVLRTSGRVPMTAPGSSTTPSMLHVRVTRLLSGQAPSRRSVWSASLANAIVVIAAAAIANQAPPLVAFESLRAPLLDAVSLWHGPLSAVDVIAGGADLRAAAPLLSMPAANAAQRAEQRLRQADAASPAVTPVNPTVVPSLPIEERSASESEPPRLSSTVLPAVLERFSLIRSGRLQPPFASSREGGHDMDTRDVPINAPAVGGLPDGNSLSRPFINMGVAAASAGVEVGQGAARVGTSVGRLFKNGSQLIARSF